MNSLTTIRFLLGSQITGIDFSKENTIRPYHTLLDFLRSNRGRHGTKEGCGIGDCGACTVVLAMPSGDKLKYLTVNSCLIYLPMIDGLQVITVEDLSPAYAETTALHPVQEALLNNQGTQCGYCTPGIVMSLFGLYKNHTEITRELAGEWLSGNLCRCTGYISILNAAMKISGTDIPDHFQLHEKETIDILTSLSPRKNSFCYTDGDFSYFRPEGLPEALELRRKFPEALLACGATEAGLGRNNFLGNKGVIIDLSAIGSMNYFHVTPSEYIIGAGMNLQDIRMGFTERLPALSNMLEHFGSLQIRNLATLAGNIAAASPVSDSLPLLICLDASVVLESSTARRIVAVKDFITGYRQTCLLKDELITAVIIPRPDSDTVIFFKKHSVRNDVDISSVNMAFSLKKDKKGILRQVNLCFGALAPTAKRAENTENWLEGKEITRDVIRKALELLDKDFTPISDVRSSALARMMVAKNMLFQYLNGLLP